MKKNVLHIKMLLDTKTHMNNLHLSVQKYLRLHTHKYISIGVPRLSSLRSSITVRTMVVMRNSNNKSLHINISISVFFPPI